MTRLTKAVAEYLLKTLGKSTSRGWPWANLSIRDALDFMKKNPGIEYLLDNGDKVKYVPRYGFTLLTYDFRAASRIK